MTPDPVALVPREGEGLSFGSWAGVTFAQREQVPVGWGAIVRAMPVPSGRPGWPALSGVPIVVDFAPLSDLRGVVAGDTLLVHPETYQALWIAAAPTDEPRP